MNQFNIRVIYANNNLARFRTFSDIYNYEYVIALYCDKMNLEYLPELPPFLQELYCQNNRLTKLPSLPFTLEVLNCQHNKLIDIPKKTKYMREIYV